MTGELENGGAVNTKAEFLYFPFDVEDKNMSGSELIGMICPDVQEWEVIRELSYMGTDCDILYRPFSTLSGGEQTRLLAEHDRYFCENTGTKRLYITKG